MQITKHFNSSEFACKDGSPIPAVYIDNMVILANQLETIREASSGVILINSGYRTPAHNKKIGGSPGSFHLRCMAADIVSCVLSPKELGTLILKLIADGKIKAGGVKIYSSWVHYDIRGKLTKF